MSNYQEIPYSQEILRKGIHLTSLSIPVGYYFVTQEIALSIILPVMVLTVVIDVMSKKNNTIHYWLHKIFGKMLRPHEFKENVLNGASWVLISAAITILLFPKILAVTGFAILIISDTTAALYGRKYGKIPLFNKSLEGTLAFIVSALVVIIIVAINVNAPWTFYLFGFFGAIVSALFEVSSKHLKIDDNLTIPISFCLFMWGCSIIANFFNNPYINIL